MEDIDKYAKENVLKFLVGNKCDLKEKREVPYEKGKELANEYGIKFFETSAKDVIGVEEMFNNATEVYLKKLEAIDTTVSTTKIHYTAQNLDKSPSKGNTIKVNNKKNSLYINVDKKNETCCGK